MLGYSPISAIDRIIEPSPQYDKFFDKPQTGQLKKKVLSNDADVEQTVDLMFDVINKHYREVNKAKHLVLGANTYDTAKKIFDFIYKHIKYNLEPGEILHTPAAVYWHGQVMARQNPGKTDQYPIDCDDMAIMAASFLKSLHLPWALRIASYDGIRYGHVYCVVPGKKEIIIDPVYIGFNKEKPYKMQKTFVGSTEGMSGIPVYLQSINGLSGFGNSETVGLITGLISGTHFQNNAQTEAIKGYLKDTLKLSQKRPDIVAKTIKPYIFENMLKRAISGLDAQDEEDILNILAEQEKQFIKSAKAISGIGDNNWYYDENPDSQELSAINYKIHKGERYFNVGNLGFFGRLKFIRKPVLINPTPQRKVVNKAERSIKMLNDANPVIKPIVSRPVNPVQISKPVINPIMVSKPVNNPVQILKPVNNPVQISKPVINQIMVSKPVNNPVQILKPLQQNNIPALLDETPIEQINTNIQPIEQNSIPAIMDENVNEQINTNADMDYLLTDFDSDSNDIVEGLISGVHFNSGIGDLGDNLAFINYLTDTKKVIVSNPEIAKKVYKNPYIFQNLIDGMIKGLKENNDKVIDTIARMEESQLINPLSGFTSEIYEIDGLGIVDVGGLGLLGRIGLLKKLKDKHRTNKIARLEKRGKTAKVESYKSKIEARDKAAKKRNQNLKNMAKMFNKVNPVTVAARNGLRLLIAINFNGLASKLKNDPKVLSKVRDLFSRMGGNVNKLNKTIETGSRKKPVTKQTGKVQTVDGLGAVVAISSIIGVAGTIVNKIMTWFKEKKENEKTDGEIVAEQMRMDEVAVSDNQPKPGLFKRVANFAKKNLPKKPTENQNINQPQTNSVDDKLQVNQTNTQTPTNTMSGSKLGLLAIGAAGIVGLLYLTRKKQAQQPVSGFTKLSGIKLK